MRYKLTLSYDGGKLCGWQVQNNARSVQGEIENALKILLGNEVAVTGAGRTDTGVNAIGYVAHFSFPSELPMETAQLCYKLNAILPKEVIIHAMDVVDDDFHARFDATSREYHYFVHLKKDPFCEKYSYRCRAALDIESMNKAARYLKGTHDFSCFEKVGGNNKTSICTVTEATWEEYVPTHCSMMGYPFEKGDYLVFRIRADRFLRNMVRAIVGSMLEVGKGKKSPEWFDSLIKDGCRSDAGASVPGNALFFSGAVYKAAK
ncbi:MAG: tRNA pseudouridine(38-40) synthase TruA [Bacteroidales bacterium]|nr:tRNA pseudouridine(38-40) synthase TruA [Bacteroidales bacterium]